MKISISQCLIHFLQAVCAEYTNLCARIITRASIIFATLLVAIVDLLELITLRRRYGIHILLRDIYATLVALVMDYSIRDASIMPDVYSKTCIFDMELSLSSILLVSEHVILSESYSSLSASLYEHVMQSRRYSFLRFSDISPQSYTLRVFSSISSIGLSSLIFALAIVMSFDQRVRGVFSI